MKVKDNATSPRFVAFFNDTGLHYCAQCLPNK